MSMRSTLADTARRSQSSSARCTLREFNDGEDMQEIKTADAGYSDSPTDFERWQQVGMTVNPMPQDKEEQQQDQQQSQQAEPTGGGEGDKIGWSDKQPKGPSAEGLMMYVGGNKEHPVCIGVDDRRVRPHSTKPGEALYYSPDGSGQCMYHRKRGDGKDGLYILTTNDQGGNGSALQTLAGDDGKQNTKRFVSIRHVNKPKQKRKSKQFNKDKGQSSGGGGGGGAMLLAAAGGNGQGGQQQEEDYKHEGDSVNTEFRSTENTMEFYDGDTKVGFYDKTKKEWRHYIDGDEMKSVVANKKHIHIRFGAMAIWVDETGCWSTMPIQQADDPG